MSEDVTPELVEIVAIRNDAVKIKGADLLKTDLLFDIYGGTHALSSVRGPSKSGQMRYKRVDVPYWGNIGVDDTITVVREPMLVKLRDGFSKQTHGVAYVVESYSMDNTVTPPREIAWLVLASDHRLSRSAWVEDLRTMDGRKVKR